LLVLSPLVGLPFLGSRLHNKNIHQEILEDYELQTKEGTTTVLKNYVDLTDKMTQQIEQDMERVKEDAKKSKAFLKERIHALRIGNLHNERMEKHAKKFVEAWVDLMYLEVDFKNWILLTKNLFNTSLVVLKDKIQKDPDRTDFDRKMFHQVAKTSLETMEPMIRKVSILMTRFTMIRKVSILMTRFKDRKVTFGKLEKGASILLKRTNDDYENMKTCRLKIDYVNTYATPVDMTGALLRVGLMPHLEKLVKSLDKIGKETASTDWGV